MFRTIDTKQPYAWVYILSNPKRIVLYIGVTRNLLQRLDQHISRENPNSFASKYFCHDLIYYEFYNLLTDAIQREKQLKKWNRSWKIELIEKKNPTFKDLSDDFKKGIHLK